MNQNLEGALSVVKCQICHQPMPAGEEMFNYHGFSGPCPVTDAPTSGTGIGIACTAARVEDAMPFTFRFAEYPNGQRRLQGGYRWHQGFQIGGVVWRDLLCVKVDEQGNELPA